MNDRFWSKVENASGADCWQWLAATDGKGYGQIFIKWVNGKSIPTKAHRVAWEELCGPIPDGMDVLHKCDNPGCVNPGHLFLGTQADNNADMVAKGRARHVTAKGEKNGQHKLTWQIVNELRFTHYFAPWVPQRFLAKCSGVSHEAIGYVLRGGTWR